MGAAIGYFVKIPQRAIAAVMAFGAGVLISALSFELMDEAYKRGVLTQQQSAFWVALLYTQGQTGIWQGVKHRKRSGKQQPSETEDTGSGLAIAVGALLDGIPESIVIGVSMIGGGFVSWVTVAAVFKLECS